MDFKFTEQQRMLKKTIAEFVKRECPPEYTRKLDEEGRFPHEVWKKLAETGFLGVSIPEEYGGSGGDILDYVILIEELSRGSIAVAFAFFLTVCFGGKSIGLYGTEEQKKFFLPKLAAGECKFSLCLTEPGGGTDILGAMSTCGERQGDYYLVNGQKTFISGADVADYFITVLRTGKNPARKADGITVLVLEAKTPGIEVRPLKKLALPSVSACEVFFEDVRVPCSCVLGLEGEGWYQLVTTLDNERIGVAAMAVGLAQGIFDRVLGYAKERQAFGRPIGQFQAIQHYLAKAATEIEAARLLLYRAAWLQAGGERCDVEATMAKYFASQTGFEVASMGISVMGGYGVMNEYDVGRHLHIAKGFTFAPISNEMCLNYIGTVGLGLPKSY
ncbi:MAG: acyl-CoA dehydrogenase family protein [Bacillota bacterium]